MVDGGSITSVGVGGSQMGFSQEVVQEFQVSTVNFDLSTGIAGAGGVNVVTRSGGNDLHGTGFYFFRDHKLAAYPALNRDPANPASFFQRRQFGFALGGPIRRDRVFFFGNWERNEQRGVIDANLIGTDFAHFSRATYKGLLLRAEKRFSHGFQALASYTYSSNTGTSFRDGFNLDNWLQNSGRQGAIRALVSVFALRRNRSGPRDHEADR